MAGTSSWIISQLMSSVQSLFNFMHASSFSLPASSSSSTLTAAGTVVRVDPVQESFMDDLSRLESMLWRVHAVLRNAEKRGIHGQTIPLWLSKLTGVAYAAKYALDDALDECNYRVLQTQEDYPEGNQVCHPISISDNIIERIRKIIENFDEIAKDREALQLREEDAMKRPPSTSLLNDRDVFGREYDKKEIIQLLMSDSEKECSVIPIVGVGDVGKTTLVQLVYNDPTISEHFSPKVWVCVSEEFDVVRVTKEIVQSIDPSSSFHNNLTDLQSVLKKALQEKRFLLVLDDIWIERQELWESLRAPFSGVGKGKIIITTRSMSAARIMKTVPPYELESWDEDMVTYLQKAGRTSLLISQLMSRFQSLFNFMPTSSSSSSALAAAGTVVRVDLIHDDLSRLERMLRRVQAVLCDAEKREIHDQTIQLWLRELREVSYAAEDALDEYNYQVLQTQVVAAEAEPSLKRKRENYPKGYQVCLPISISDNMVERIRKIVEKFDEIAKDREALHLREEDGVRRPSFDDAIKRPPSSSFVNDSNVFGREDDKKKIIQMLMSDSEKECSSSSSKISSNLSVIPIIGMGGVGKTTLVQLVYNDPIVSEHFSPKVWVCVSEEFDAVRVTREIVQSIDPSSSSFHHNNLNDLQCMLNKVLQEKRFLLVLDDIWIERPEIWESLIAPFSGVGKGKIIITTRSMSVARIMHTVPPRELRCLDEGKSWMLFKKHAFYGWKPIEQQDFEEIGRKIAMKCGGLPLALKALGGVLRYEVDEQIWLDVLNNDLWELEKIKNLILPALRISYEHLPAHLKPCFVYASLFPKDFRFDKTELIRLWMAQGYIQLAGRNKLLEDIASEYFDELQMRSFFQVYTILNPKEFVLHDMIHDLARSISENEIYSMLDLEELKCIPRDVKHIYLCLEKVRDFPGENTTIFPLFGDVRTFHLKMRGCTFEKEVMDLFPRFRYLRALKIDARKLACNLQFISWISKLKHLRFLSIVVNKSMQIGDDPFSSLYNLQTLVLISKHTRMLTRGIGKLINLRHLVLCCSVEMLPKSICQLQMLLTLDIKNCFALREMPLSLFKLTNLRHLNLPNKCCIPDGIVKLTNLQTLDNVNLCQHSEVQWLRDLVNLRGSLRISGLSNVLSLEDAMSANLQSKQHIKRLHLDWRTCTYADDDECTMQEEDVLSDEYTMREKDVLGGLQPHTHLEDLVIEGYGGNKFPRWFGDPHFSKLTIIKLTNFWNSKECKFVPLSRLPSLKYLIIQEIKGIKIMGHDFWCYPHPDGDHGNNSTVAGFTEVHVGFPSLEHLSFSLMDEWEEWRMKNGDFPNLKHLSMTSCPKLQLLPTLPSSVEEFGLLHCERLRNLTLHDSSGPPSSLQRLTIVDCPQLEPLQQVPDHTKLEIYNRRR